MTEPAGFLAARTAQTTVGSYLLVERLGAGGVGEVWKARDRLLDRIVALKFIPAPRQGSSPMTDLLREARAASALNHPNIITIFEVGERDGGSYLAMEFVEGETLRSRLRRGRVPIAEAVDIGSQIADGLASAHAQGIVHRDLKPENIMLRIDGYVKLVDFGLAKIIPRDPAATGDVTTATDSGHLAGTFTYMSPEQARSQSVTPATDVFAFGIVMYELLTGENPFRGETVLDTLNAIVNTQPPGVEEKAPDVPAALAAVVVKALQKSPTERYPSAAALREPLKQIRSTPAMSAILPAGATSRRPRSRWPMAAAAALLLIVLAVWIVASGRAARADADEPIRSVAIMTLRVDPNDQTAARFADGFAEDLGTSLAALGLNVLSSAAVFERAATARSDELGVNALVEGTVRTVDGRLRVHVEVVRARSRFQIWSGTFTPSENEARETAFTTDVARQLRAGVVTR